MMTKSASADALPDEAHVDNLNTTHGSCAAKRTYRAPHAACRAACACQIQHIDMQIARRQMRIASQCVSGRFQSFPASRLRTKTAKRLFTGKGIRDIAGDLYMTHRAGTLIQTADISTLASVLLSALMRNIIALRIP